MIQTEHTELPQIVAEFVELMLEDFERASKLKDLSVTPASGLAAMSTEPNGSPTSILAITAILSAGT